MEYAAYKGVDNIIDYAGLTDKFAGKITDISNDREKRKEELNQMATDASRELSEIEMTKTESLNDKILGLADQGREKINGWQNLLINGEISENQFKRNMSSVNEYTSLVAATAKTFDAKMQEYIKRQADGTGSAVELEKIDRFGMMTDLQNIDFKVLDDGRIAVDVKDPKTGKSIRQEDLLRINKSENAQTPRMNLSKEVNTVVKNWAADGIVKYMGQGSYESSASAMNDPQYKLDKQRLVDQLVTQNAVSLLVDNGGVTTVNYAYNDEDKKAKLKEIIAKEKDVRKRAGQDGELTAEEIADLETGIIIIDNNGDVQLTDDQIDKAREAADREIDLQVGNELKAVAPQNWYGKSSSTGKTALDKFVPGMYDRLAKAWELSKTDPKAGANALSALAGGDYKFEWTRDGLMVYTEVQMKDRKGNPIYEDILTDKDIIDKETGKSTGKKLPSGKKRPKVAKQAVATGKNLVDFASFFYGEGTAAGGEDIAIAEFNEDKRLSKSRKGGNENSNDPLDLDLK